MADPNTSAAAPRSKRTDARRNERVLLDAAAAVFVTHGVDAPVRLIAAEAGVGMGTIYRHFPTRPAVYRHQVEALAEAGPAPLQEAAEPSAALRRWVAGFVDFLVTKHGLAGAMGADADGADALHRYFLDQLVPVCDALLLAALGDTGTNQISGFMLMRGIGNLCIGAGNDARYDAGRLVDLLVTGLLTTEQRSGRSRSEGDAAH
ncbi:TetR/AcrR family transcriptional regulator [Streptomyces mirabilis]|uniref:TetR/AcrR family transcriptional regulator n=1 Tax=Streptomyces mirabilis TaxID=68239 RepID=UPI003646337A